MKKYLLLLLISLIFSTGLMYIKLANKVFAECIPACSTITAGCGGTTYSDWWECNNGNMCCHGSGCPSWVCEGQLIPVCPDAWNCTLTDVINVTYNTANNTCQGTCKYTCVTGFRFEYVTKEIDLVPPHCCSYCTTDGDGDGDGDGACVPSWGACSASCDGGTQSDGCGNTRACNTQMCPPAITNFYIAKSLISMDHNATETMNQQTGIPFYIVLAMQMHLRTLPINWEVLTLHTGTCTASCIYVDKQGIRLQDGAGQPDDCQFHGTVGATRVLHNAFQVQPQHQGIVTYSLTCSNAGGSDTKTFQVGVKLFSWREVLRVSPLGQLFINGNQIQLASILDAIRTKLSPGR